MAFAVQLPTNSIPSPLPDTSYRIEVVQRSEGGVKGTSFYIPYLDAVEALLAKIRKDGRVHEYEVEESGKLRKTETERQEMREHERHPSQKSTGARPSRSEKSEKSGEGTSP